MDWLVRSGSGSGLIPVISRFLVAGGAAAGINLTAIYCLTEYVGLWYLTSSALAFCIAFMVSFTLQKWWTFRDASTDGIRAQAGVYLGFAVCNLAINTALMFVFVEKIGLQYFVAQVCTAGFLAIESFVIYRYAIFARAFRKHPPITH